MEKILVDWVEDQINHNISLTQHLNQNKSLTLFSSVKAEKTAEEMFEDTRSWLMRFKEKSCFYNIDVQGYVSRTLVEAQQVTHKVYLR
jgi:hypothetical protein